MRPIAMMMVIGSMVLGCKGKDAAPKPTGSTGSSVAEPTEEPAQESQRLTTAELGKRYRACLGFADAGKWDDYTSCYAERHAIETVGRLPWRTVDEEIEVAKQRAAELTDYRREPQLMIYGFGGSNDHVFAVLLITATRGGAKVAALAGHHVKFDGDGKIEVDKLYIDDRALTGAAVRAPATPWPTKVDLPITDDADATFANIRVHAALVDAMTKTGAKKLDAVLADDLVWSDQVLPADLDKAAVIAHAEERRTQVAKLRFDTPIIFGAGDYLTIVESVIREPASGDPTSSTHLAVYRLTDGKITRAWLFHQPPK